MQSARLNLSPNCTSKALSCDKAADALSKIHELSQSMEGRLDQVLAVSFSPGNIAATGQMLVQGGKAIAGG